MWRVLFWFAAAVLLGRLAPRLFASLSVLMEDVPSRMFATTKAVCRWMSSLVTRNGTMDASQAVTFLGMSAVITGVTVVLGIIAYNLLVPSLGPILGLPGDDLTMVPALARGAIIAIVLPVFVAGVSFADLAGWVRTTPLAYARNGLRTALFIVVGTLVLCLVAALAAGAYRGGIMIESVIGVEATTTSTSYMAALIVVLIDVVVLAGIFLGGISFEGAFHLVALLFAAVAAMVLAVLGCCAALLNAVLTPLGVFLTELLDGLTSFWEATREGAGRRLGGFLEHEIDRRGSSSVTTSSAG